MEVAGSAGMVEVPETAAGAQVKVAEGASVGTLNVAAPKTNVEVSGSVSSLTVQETVRVRRSDRKRGRGGIQYDFRSG